MSSIFVFSEFFINGYIVEILDVVTLLAVLSGILVIIINNPVVSVLFLIGLFVSIASYLSLLGLTFIGLSYLLVYVGAVSILFLFILMLINVRVSELSGNASNSIVLAIFIGISITYPLNNLLPSYSNTFSYDNIFKFNGLLSDLLDNIFNFMSFFSELGSGANAASAERDYGGVSFVTSHVWDGYLAETNHITSIGNIMYTSYSIWLILTSIILLLAMVGSIVITIKQKD